MSYLVSKEPTVNYTSFVVPLSIVLAGACCYGREAPSLEPTGPTLLELAVLVFMFLGGAFLLAFKETASSSDHIVAQLDPNAAQESYARIVNLLIHAETISWNRFYMYLVSNSILFVGWSTLMTAIDGVAASSHEPHLRRVSYAICLAGMLGGVIWAAFGVRSRRFLDYYAGVARRLELKHPDQLPRLFHFDPIDVRGKYTRIEMVARSGLLFVLVPLCAFLGYAFLLLVPGGLHWSLWLGAPISLGLGVFAGLLITVLRQDRDPIISSGRRGSQR